MSGETESNVSAWTIDSLKQHLELVYDERDRRYQQRFEAQEKAMQAALTAAKEAVDKAERAIGERLVLLNEFRGQSKDEQSKFVTRMESEAAIGRNSERIQELVVLVHDCATRAELTVSGQRFMDRLQVLETRANLTEGKSTGINAAYVYLIAFIGVIGSIVTIYLSLRH